MFGIRTTRNVTFVGFRGISMIRLVALAGGVVLCGFVWAEEDGKDAQSEVKKLKGTWKTANLIWNGKDYLASGKKGFNFVFKGDVATIEGNDAVQKEYAKIRVKLDLSTMPKMMDITVLGGIQKDAVIESIYELKGDELKICAKVFGKERPSEFASPAGSSIALLVLKREE